MARIISRRYIGAMDVKAIRRKTGLTAPEFAATYRLPRRTVETWESSRRTGASFTGTTETLLRMIEADPSGTAAIIAKAFEAD